MNLTAEQLVTVLQQAIERDKAGGLSPRDHAAPMGNGGEYTWSKWKAAIKEGTLQFKIKETSLTPFTTTLYGCTGIFGLCGPDEVIGMTMADDPLIDWLGFVPDTVCERFVKAWSYFDQEGTADGSVVGTIYGDACEDPPTSEKGAFEYFIGDFGTLRGCGEAIRVTDQGLRKCDKQPTYTIPTDQGPIRIDNDLDLESLAAAEMVKHELSREVITGDKSVNGQFDGLSNLVKTGYFDINGNTRTEIDSTVFDWANDYMTGLVNGHGSIIKKIRDMYRLLRWKITQTRMGAPAEGDMVLVMPTWLAWELLDEFAIWTFREQVNGVQVVYRDYKDVNDLREKHSGGMFGAGYITIDGFNLHIIAHDWLPWDQAAPKFIADIYILTRRIGGRRVLYGQYVPVDVGANAVNSLAGYSYFQTEAMQGGRALRWLKYDNACVKPCLLIRPRIYSETMWANGKIENVAINPQFDPLSRDPQSDYWTGGTPRTVQSITQYWYNDSGTWFS